MRRIDAHQHFWQFEAGRDSWITDNMSVIRHDFLPEHLEPILKENDIEGCMVVQSDQSPAENKFQLANAASNDFIKGIVGWVDLISENLEAELEELSTHKKLKGFRHVLQGEAPSFMLQPAFKRGIGLLSKFGFTYDLLLFPEHLENAETLVASFPDQPFVLDHIAKPLIKSGEIEDWKKKLVKLAQHENVFCKISGLITEADWNNWSAGQFKPYLDTVFEAFGTGRLMFGSDWPVCLVAGSYKAVLQIAEDAVAMLSDDERSAFWAGNAESFYHLS